MHCHKKQGSALLLLIPVPRNLFNFITFNKAKRNLQSVIQSAFVNTLQKYKKAHKIDF